MSIAAEICKEKEIKFELKDEGNFVSAVFYRKIENKSSEKSSEKGSEKVSEKYRISIGLANNRRKNREKPADTTLQEEKVLELFKLKNKVTVFDIEKLFNIKSARAREILSKMVKKKLIKKIGKTKGAYYIINEDKNEQ